MTHHLTTRIAIIVAILGSLFSVPSSAQAQTIVNGSFENGSFVADGNKVMSLNVGSTVMTGWTTFNAELVWARSDNPFITPAADGNFFLDLTGYHDSTPYGGVQQSITTSATQPYRVTFSLGVKQDSSIYAGPITVRVAATGNSSQDFTYNPPGNSTLWGDFNYDFVATGSSTTLSLLGITSTGGQFIGLDNVRIAAVPELGSLTLGLTAGAGLFSGCIWARRRSIKKRMRQARLS